MEIVFSLFDLTIIATLLHRLFGVTSKCLRKCFHSHVNVKTYPTHLSPCELWCNNFWIESLTTRNTIKLFSLQRNRTKSELWIVKCGNSFGSGNSYVESLVWKTTKNEQTPKGTIQSNRNVTFQFCFKLNSNAKM